MRCLLRRGRTVGSDIGITESYSVLTGQRGAESVLALSGQLVHHIGVDIAGHNDPHETTFTVMDALRRKRSQTSPVGLRPCPLTGSP
eukprot:3587770-Rhodomonas_salina.1